MAEKKPRRKRTPPVSPEAAERQCMDAAYALALKQLEEGTASPSVITHFLKIGTLEQERKLEKLRQETNLLERRKDSIDASEQATEMYSKAIAAMMRYSGKQEEEVPEDLFY